MTIATDVFSSSVATEVWEPLVEDGQQIGEVHFLLQSRGFTATWRTRSPFLKFFVIA